MTIETYTKYEGAEAIQYANLLEDCNWKWWRYERTSGSFALVALSCADGWFFSKAFLVLQDCVYIRFNYSMSNAQFQMGAPDKLAAAMALPLPEYATSSQNLIIMRNETDEYCLSCRACSLYQRIEPSAP